MNFAGGRRLGAASAFLIATLSLAAALLASGASPAWAAPKYFTVQRRILTELAPVFGTIQGSRNLQARARIAGTVVSLAVKDGDHVAQGQVLAVVADSTLLSRKAALVAEIAGNRAQLAEAKLAFTRVRSLVAQGAVSRASFDKADSARQQAQSALAARLAERSTIDTQIAQGAVHAPGAGLILHVPVARGSVLLRGDTVAQLAAAPLRVRLAVPERYARFLHRGSVIRADGRQLGASGTLFGKIAEIKPVITNGRMIAYAQVRHLPGYFVGAHVQVWLPAQRHPAIVIPSAFILTLSGSDYARIEQKNDPQAAINVPIQRGGPRPSPAMPNGVEILSGLKAGDVLVQP